MAINIHIPRGEAELQWFQLKKKCLCKPNSILCCLPWLSIKREYLSAFTVCFCFCSLKRVWTQDSGQRIVIQSLLFFTSFYWRIFENMSLDRHRNLIDCNMVLNSPAKELVDPFVARIHISMGSGNQMMGYGTQFLNNFFKIVVGLD